MKILMASDFLADFELYETDNEIELIDCFKAMLNGSDVELNDKHHKLIGSSEDTLETDDALNQADKVVYISDLME